MNQVEFQPYNREVQRNKEREGHFSYGIECLREQLAPPMCHGEPGKEGCKYQADIECPSDHAISQQNSNRIGQGRVFCEDIEPRRVDSLYDPGKDGEPQSEKSDCGDQVIRHLAWVEYGLP